MRRQELLAINASSITVLGAGFVSSLLIPRLAITSFGLQEYGTYALYLGYSLIPTAVEFGLTPGMTREIGVLYAKGDVAGCNVIASALRRIVAVGGLATVLAVAWLGMRAVKGRGMAAVGFWAVLFGGLAAVIFLVADVGLVRVRVAGSIVSANLARIGYLLSNLSAVTVFFVAHRLTIVNLFVAQLCGSLVYFAVCGRLVRRAWPRVESDPRTGRKGIPWRRILLTAAPEELNRVQGSILPSIERQLMFTYGGGAFLSAYDVALRVSAMVTSAPAALADPLVALLSPRLGPGRHAERRQILHHSDQAMYITVVLAAVGAVIFVMFLAPRFYRLAGTSFRQIAALVVIGSGFNVLTVTAKGMLYAYGRPKAIIAKSLGDIGFAVAGLLVLVTLHNSMDYVGIRYLGFLVTAAGLLAWARRARKRIDRAHQAASTETGA
jgi:O-antigen/teichoic acid export membrane protein